MHLAHGVRNTAAGLRYTFYLFMTDLNDISKSNLSNLPVILWRQIMKKQLGDVSNVLFSNGWIKDEDGTVYIYYASSDTRCHVAVSSIEKLLDYVKNSPQDKFTSGASVDNIIKQIEKNKSKK